MGYSEKFISRIMSIEAQLETYEESGSVNNQKKVLQKLLVEVENMKSEYLKGEDDTFLDKIKRFFGFKMKEPDHELLPMIEELIVRVVEENRKVGNLYRSS
ncbi:MAG: hypothetical protein EP216_02685 [Epsilonproteobacteria bacterium]|nr:MAG: hypothetical protein EP216_02685 [Campylobacterota bacterium]